MPVKRDTCALVLAISAAVGSTFLLHEALTKLHLRAEMMPQMHRTTIKVASRPTIKTQAAVETSPEKILKIESQTISKTSKKTPARNATKHTNGDSTTEPSKEAEPPIEPGFLSPTAEGLPAVPPAPAADPLDEIPDAPKFGAGQSPGGDVLVLALYVDSRGSVIASRIIVPSKNSAMDITYQLAARGYQYKPEELEPPIEPGKGRWIEERFVYQSEDKNSSFLP